MVNPKPEEILEGLDTLMIQSMNHDNKVFHVRGAFGKLVDDLIKVLPESLETETVVRNLKSLEESAVYALKMGDQVTGGGC